MILLFINTTMIGTTIVEIIVKHMINIEQEIGSQSPFSNLSCGSNRSETTDEFVIKNISLLFFVGDCLSMVSIFILF
jgi:hypothetical protein